MTIIARDPDNPASDTISPTDLRSAAWNACAIASHAWQEETFRLRYILSSAQRHGLSVDEIAEATGLHDDRVRDLIADAS